MKKIFLLLISIGIIASVLLYFTGDKCENARYSDPHSFLNPLGLVSHKIDLIDQSIAIGKVGLDFCIFRPNTYFYLSTDITVLLFILFLIYLLSKNLKLNKKTDATI